MCVISPVSMARRSSTSRLRSSCQVSVLKGFPHSPKWGRRAVPLSRDDALDEVPLQLAAHSRRAVAAHADEADASAYQALDRRYADILFEAGRNNLGFIESYEEDATHRFPRFAAAIASLAFV